MRKQELINYAIKGVMAEIRELEKDVRKGYKFLEDMNNGVPVKTPLNQYEIKEVIAKKKAEIEELDKKRNDLKWELAMIESE